MGPILHQTIQSGKSIFKSNKKTLPPRKFSIKSSILWLIDACKVAQVDSSQKEQSMCCQNCLSMKSAICLLIKFFVHLTHLACINLLFSLIVARFHTARPRARTIKAIGTHWAVNVINIPSFNGHQLKRSIAYWTIHIVVR